MRALMTTLAAGVSIAAAQMLTGCASPAEIRQADANQCNGYGFAPGTDAHANCMQKIARDRQKSMEAFMSAPAAGTKPAASTTECSERDRGNSTTTGSSTSTTTGMPGNSTTTGSSSSTTSSSGSSFTMCTNK